MTADDVRAGPPTGHADLDTLADLHAGGLDEAEAARVRGHVDGCTQCSATLAALDSVQAQLRSLPAPPVPAAVAGRLDATLAGLRTERSAPAARPARPAAPALDPEDELELARARRVHRLTRAIGAVAAAVVVIAAGGAVAAIVRTATSSDSATSGAGGAASAPVAPKSEGERPGATDLHSAGRGQAAVPAYDRSSLRAALPTIAAQGTSRVPASMADPARRAACAGSIPTAAGSLRGVQRILYRNQPAYVFVYDDGGRLTGYVVTDACGTAPGLPATVVDRVS
jgi:hypothetical protein